MKLLIKENKILLLIIAIAVIVSLITIGMRFSVENQNKTYDIVLDYNEIEAMAEQSEHDVSWWLNEFKKSGITKVGLLEENMSSLMESTDMPIHAQVMDIIMKDADWEADYPEDFIREFSEFGYDKYDLFIKAASSEAFDFVAEGIKVRYQPENYFIWQGENGGYIVLNGTAKQTLYSEKYKTMTSITKKPFMEKDDIVSSKLMYLNFGLLPSKVRIVEDAGMDIIPRTASYEGWNDTKYAEAVIESYENLDIIPEYMIVGGEAVIGWDDGIDTARDYVTENNIIIGLIEDTTQLQNILQYGVNGIVSSNDYEAVRIFSVWDYIQNRYQYYGYEGAKEIENTLFRSIVERNVRLIYFKPIKEYKDLRVYVTDPEEYSTMFTNLENRLDEHGIRFGKASVMENYSVSPWAKVIMALGCVAAAILLIRAILPIGRKLKIGLFALGALGVVGAFAVMPHYAELLTSFAAAVIFPCIAILFIVRQSKEFTDTLDRSEGLPKIIGLGILTLVLSVVISMLGGMMTAAPISSVSYMLEIDIFRGVKLAQILPIAFFALAYLAYYGFGDTKKHPGTLEYNDLKDMMNSSIKVWMVLLGIVLLGVGYYYIERTGHDTAIQVSTLEMIFRNTLEDNLVARPRTKEFILAFPAVIMLAYTSIRRFKLWPIMFGLASVIGMTSVANTFMHIRTPLYLGFYRTAYAILFGIVIGIIGIAIFELGHKLYKKLERQII